MSGILLYDRRWKSCVLIIRFVRSMWNFEVAPPDSSMANSKVSELLVSESEVVDNYSLSYDYAKYYHFNMYDHFDEIVERPGTRTSSVRRKEAAEKL